MESLILILALCTTANAYFVGYFQSPSDEVKTDSQPIPPPILPVRVSLPLPFLPPSFPSKHLPPPIPDFAQRLYGAKYFQKPIIINEKQKFVLPPPPQVISEVVQYPNQDTVQYYQEPIPNTEIIQQSPEAEQWDQVFVIDDADPFYTFQQDLKSIADEYGTLSEESEEEIDEEVNSEKLPESNQSDNKGTDTRYNSSSDALHYVLPVQVLSNFNSGYSYSNYSPEYKPTGSIQTEDGSSHSTQGNLPLPLYEEPINDFHEEQQVGQISETSNSGFHTSQNHNYIPQTQFQNHYSAETGPNIIKTLNDGGYEHTYTHDDGTRISEEGTIIPNPNGEGNVVIKSGQYEYVSPDGVPVKVKWVADQDGFRTVE